MTNPSPPAARARATIDATKPLTLKQVGIDLPKVPPTQVMSIRLPSTLLNQLKAFASAHDAP